VGAPSKVYKGYAKRKTWRGLTGSGIGLFRPQGVAACARTSRAFQCVMAKKSSRSRFAWSMQHDRELIALVKAHIPLQTIAKKLDGPVTTIIRRTARLGLSIERVSKAKQ
jgi:hypothetical protein